MIARISKIKTTHVTIKQEIYKLEDNNSQGHEEYDPPKLKKGVKTKGKQLVCPECSKHFSKQGNLKSHQLVHTGEKPYSCEKCDGCFTQLGHLKMHELTHMNREKFKCPFLQ